MDSRNSLVAAIALAAISVVGLVLIGVLVVTDHVVPDALFAITGGSIGALAGLLAPNPTAQ